MAKTQIEEFYVEELKSMNELIQKFFEIFRLKEKNIRILSPGLSDLQQKFKPKYQKFSKIKRFAIPVIGRISCGKSTFLNFLTGLNNGLETDTQITTKVVCIIRHNILAIEPKAYSVKFEKRDLEYEENNSLPKLNFEKGEELRGNIKKIIEQKNKYILDTKPERLKKEDFFIIIETKIPIFNNEEMVKYSKIFEFMDLPGLNEYNKNDNDFFKQNILPIISFNVKFSFFIFDCLSLKDKDTTEIYNNYKGLLNEEIENNFYILNKIDYSDNEREVELENFKNYLLSEFNVNIDKNYFLTTNSILLVKELEKFNNFQSYLNYKITEIKNIDIGSGFVGYLKKEMKKDLKIENINLKEIKINLTENENAIISEFLMDINAKLITIGFGGELDPVNYYRFKNVFENNNKIGKMNNIIVDKIKSGLLTSFKNSFESFVNLKDFKNQIEELKKKLQIDYSSNNTNKIIEKFQNQSNFMHLINKIKELKKIILELERLEPNNDFIKKRIKENDELLTYLDKDSKIRISILGLYSSGKSTILNNIIGLDILPTHSDECTRRGVIIRYHNKTEPELYKTKFIKKLDYYYFEENESLICKGFSDVQKKLENLNKTQVTFEKSFYILKIKIKLFDDFNFDKKIKNKFEFIDFPGLHTKNHFCEENIFNPLMRICDGFIFVNKSDLINDKSNVDALKEIIIRVESRKFFFNLNSCLFIINNFGSNRLNINKAKLTLEELVFGKINESKGFWSKFKSKKNKESNLNLNVTEFNAGIYKKYVKFYQKIENFKNFIINSKREKDEEDDTNSFLQFIESHYLKFFDEIDFPTPIAEINLELYGKFSDVIKGIDKNEVYKIIQHYIFMRDNKDKNIFYRNSNAKIFFTQVKDQLMIAKNNFDDDCRNIFINYIKNLSYIFKIINLNLLGNFICRKENIEKSRNEVISTHEKYKNIIIDKFKKLEKNCFEIIDKYLLEINEVKYSLDQSSNLISTFESESKKISETIINIIKEAYKAFEETIKACKKKYENIIENFIIHFHNENISFNDEIYKNFFSVKHGISHISLGVVEFLVGISLSFGPISWVFAIFLHVVLAGGFLIYDNVNKIDALEENMKTFKKNLKIKFKGDKEKIVEILTNMKNSTEKGIELFIDSQNSEFKGIKKNKHDFDILFDKFKNLNKTI